jgi:4-hydroxy-3-polyprenylbenzoate decarboxylase
MYASLRDFVNALESAGELKRIRERVSPVLVIAAAADLASKSRAPSLPSASARRNDPRFHDLGGPALLFEQVEGSNIPVLINAWGSYRRMEMALGCHEGGHTPGGFDALGARIGALVKPEPPRSLAELWSKARQFLPLLRIPPRRRSGRGPCQQVVRTGAEVDCTTLPLIRCWPHDGDPAAMGYPAGVNDQVPGLGRGPEWEARSRGRYITLAGIHTVHAEDRDEPKPPSHNIGMYRVQLLGPRTLAMHWHMHHDGARHWRSWKALGKPMPVAVVLGGESVMPYAATAPLPPGISELLLAGFLNRGGIPLVRGVSVPLWVPANAEIVIEGYVRHDAGLINYDPRTGEPLGPGAVFEGPFGDHTGFYSLPDRYPILDVTAITHRANPIYPTTVVGLPPQEDYFLGKATERVFFPLLKTLIHDIEDYDLPMFGAFHNAAFLRIKKAYPLQGRRVMHSVWGAGQMAWTKTLFVVDDEVDVHDTLAVLRQTARFCHPLRDVEAVNGPLDILDHAAPRLGAGTKIGFDCTRKIPGEEVGGIALGDSRHTPRPLAPAGEREAYLRLVRALPGVVDAAWPEAIEGWLLVTIDKARPGQGREIIEAIWRLGDPARGGLPPFVIVLAGEADLADLDVAFFHWCAHTDAGRDAHRWQSLCGQVHRLAFDATPKQPGDEHAGEPVRDWPPLLKMDSGAQAQARALLSAAGVSER